VTGRRREAALVGLVAAWLLVVAAPATVRAVEVEAPEPDQETTVEVQQTGYWTTPAPRTAPKTLREEFPPGVTCLVIPQLCGEEAQTVTDPVQVGVVGAQEDAEPEPVQPVPDGSLPVGVLFGEQRYASALEFDAPEIPEGEEPTIVELVLEVETEPTGVESPVFQAAVDAAVGQVAEAQGGDDPSPDPFLEVLGEVAEGETEPASELDPPEIIVCGIVEPWEGGENQDAEEIPSTDHCIFGGSGEPVDAEGEAWAFDITAAVSGWLEDDPEFGLENHGVLILPGPTTPLAYGDPDYTTNFLGAFAEPQEAEIRFATTEAFDGGFADETAIEGGVDDESADEGVAEGGFDPAPQPDTAQPLDTSEERSAEAPDVADESERQPDQSDQPEQPEAAPSDQQATETGAEPEMPWYVWLLLPVAVGGAWWYSRLHDVAVPEELGAGESGGAMSRLVQRVRGG
jgi:hypothetical protein